MMLCSLDDKGDPYGFRLVGTRLSETADHLRSRSQKLEEPSATELHEHYKNNEIEQTAWNKSPEQFYQAARLEPEPV
jgi:hypothetical protein